MKVKTASSSSASYLVVGLLVYVVSLLLPKAISDCPLDLGRANFTLAASICSNNDERAKCCRYINACLAVSVSRYANATGDLGVTSDLTEICLSTISKTLELHGVPRNAMVSCGFGTKIPVNYECQGRMTVTQMLRSAGFEDVTRNCMVPLSVESNCRKCVNAGIVYLHHLAGTEDSITFSTCRDATYAAIASQVDNITSLSIAACFFGIQELSVGAVSNASQSSPTPEASQSPVVADSPSQLVLGIPLKESHHSYHLTLVPGIGIVVTVGAVLMLVVLVFLIRRKGKELEDSNNMDVASSKTFPPQSIKKLQEGQSLMFRKFSYKDTKKATDNFKTVIGQGGFGTVYKAQFSDGSVLAVKHMDKVSKQGEDDFCREIELLARLHHRHLVALRGFCIKKHKRFLMYEYMANGNLKDHLHASQRPLSWQRRIQIAIDVANALEYLHFYCDPPLCHRDIKSSNILLDENFVAKVADFGLAHASKDGSICFEPVNTDIRGTPGYMDPEYVVTHELTEKSDVYSYGVLLLELVTARRAIQDSKNLVEWAQPYLSSYLQVSELVDVSIRGSFDLEQLHTVTTIVQWCTQREGQARPSIKQVLRLLYESSDPVHSGFIHSADEDFEGSEGSRGRPSKGKMHKTDNVFHSGEGRFLASSSSTSRSYCSRSFLLDNSSPHSPPNIPSL